MNNIKDFKKGLVQQTNSLFYYSLTFHFIHKPSLYILMEIGHKNKIFFQIRIKITGDVYGEFAKLAGYFG